MIYEKTVKKITSYFAHELNLDEKQADRIRYGLEVIISTLFSFLTALILAFVLGITPYVMYILFSVALVKVYSGGIHLKTPVECAFSTAIFSNLLAYISIYLAENLGYYWIYYAFLVAAVSLLSFVLYSPAEVPEKPIRAEAKRKRLKFISICISAIFFIFAVFTYYFYQDKLIYLRTCILTGLLFQSLAITPMAYRLLQSYYHFKKGY